MPSDAPDGVLDELSEEISVLIGAFKSLLAIFVSHKWIVAVAIGGCLWIIQGLNPVLSCYYGTQELVQTRFKSYARPK